MKIFYFCLLHLNKSNTKGKEGHRNLVFLKRCQWLQQNQDFILREAYSPHPVHWSSSQALKVEEDFVLTTQGRRNSRSTLLSTAQQKQHRSCIFLSHLFPAVGSMCKCGFKEQKSPKISFHFLCNKAKSTASPTGMIHTKDGQQAASPKHHCKKLECYQKKCSKNTSQQIK